jgi:hypothetical protein
MIVSVAHDDLVRFISFIECYNDIANAIINEYQNSYL